MVLHLTQFNRAIIREETFLRKNPLYRDNDCGAKPVTLNSGHNEILFYILLLPSSAQERKERPQFKLGGALRFNYNFSDWNSGHRDRGGDWGYDVFMLRPTASYKGFLLDADCRFYSTAFGGFMLKYGWIGYRVSEKNHLAP